MSDQPQTEPAPPELEPHPSSDPPPLDPDDDDGPERESGDRHE